MSESQGTTERERRTLDYARQIAEVAARRDAAKTAWDRAKAEASAAQQAADDERRSWLAIKEELDHLVEALAGNERGQLTLPFRRESTDDAAADPAAASADQAESSGDQTPAIDEGARQPLRTLLQYGLSQSKLDQFEASQYGDLVKTIGEFEKLQRDSNGYYWQEIRGWGESFATGDGAKALPQIQLRFRQAHPVPREQYTGPKKCLHCGFIYRNASRCKNCRQTIWEPWEEDLK